MKAVPSLLLLCGTLALAMPASAQLRLPSLPSLPRELPRLPTVSPELLPQTLAALQDRRLATVRELLRRHADQVEADPAGQPMRRQELLLVSPPAALLAAALAEGFVLLREETLAELEIRQLVLRPPPGLGTAQAVARLRAIDASAMVDFNHLYTPGGEVVPAEPAATASAPPRLAPRRVGLVDGGVDSGHAALAGLALQRWGCGGAERPSAHGTAVASLLVGRDAVFAGVLPGATLLAADVYCEQPAGGSAEEVARALAWLAGERVAVINVSLVGPANLLLAQAVAALVRKGHLVVAAVGNDGPAAPPLYPAAYPGVVGVTGIGAARRVLPEAAQGPQVLFAAPGSEMAVARPGGGYGVARGTSFAAPVVAGLLAETLAQPGPQEAAAALQQLARQAVDLGAPGRDPVYGFGLVGEALRVAPESVHARSR